MKKNARDLLEKMSGLTGGNLEVGTGNLLADLGDLKSGTKVHYVWYTGASTPVFRVNVDPKNSDGWVDASSFSPVDLLDRRVKIENDPSLKPL